MNERRTLRCIDLVALEWASLVEPAPLQADEDTDGASDGRFLRLEFLGEGREAASGWSERCN
jgi:hypothetical protein